MFFSQSSTSPQRKKQPHQLFQRVLSKPQKGIDQLKQYLNFRLQLKQYSEVQSILNYVMFRNTHQVNAATRIYLIQCLQLITLQIKDVPQTYLQKQIPQVITLILNYFKDPFDKVRYQAITSIYNIISFYNTSYLSMFTQTFCSLLPIISDISVQIRVVIFHLNHSLKRLLNLLISANQYFDVNQFMALLIQNFITESSFQLKQFLIDWLIAIDQIPQFEISFYLPLVFKELFKLMEGQNQALRDKSEQCLKNFLSGFKQLLRSRTRINQKIRQDSFSMLMSVLLQVVKQSLNPKIKYHSLQWLEVFTQLFYNQLIKKQHVEVRRSFRSQYLLKQMKQPKNPHRTSKILSFIREQMIQGDSQNGQDTMNLMSGIDFLPTPREKGKSQQLMIQQQLIEDDDPFYQQIHMQKAVTNAVKTTQFLVQIFLSFYDKIIILVMHSFSDDYQKIRKITIMINNILLESFPIVQQKAKNLKSQMPVHTIITSQSQTYLQKLEIPLIIKLGKFLKQSRTSHKIQAIIKWIKILYEKGTNPQLNLQISSLIQKIVQKICEKPVTNLGGYNQPTTPMNRSSPIPQIFTNHVSFNINKGLFNLLADSIFMQKYLDLFIQTLLSYLYQNEGIDFERILIDIISMKIKYQDKVQKKEINQQTKDSLLSDLDSTQLIYITILKRLMLFQAQKGKFKQKMIQNMISILITENSLSGLRKKLRSTSIRQKYLLKNSSKNNKQFVQNPQILQLIHQLFEYFCLNEGFTIIFCFLTGMYNLISKILKHIAQQNILDRPRIKSFIKASNLLQCYNLNHCKMDVLKSYSALKGYLGFIMVIPPSKLNKVLINKFPQDFVLQADDQQDQKQDEFENKLFESYIKILQKHTKQLIQIQKQQEQRRQRQKQTTITLQLNKQLTKQLKLKNTKQLKSKSILKPTSSKVLKQSQSQKNLKPSLSFKLIQPSQSHKQLSFYQFDNHSMMALSPRQQDISPRQVSPRQRDQVKGYDEYVMAQSYQEGVTGYQLSDQSLKFGGSQSGTGNDKVDNKQQLTQKQQQPKRKKKQSKIKVVDMRIQ